ncbi:fibronectin type III domain-containing protein [Candidatus Fermentibacteria bacterium]|nr:fibronectin type III domain-containing protein [Candidatus Fermentibacteria bacterium]
MARILWSLAVVLLAAVPSQAIDIGDLHTNNSQGQTLWNGSIVTVSGVITVGVGTFSTTYTDAYVQDVTGGIMVYHPAIPVNFALGDSVTLTGEIQQYRGMLELVPDSAQVELHASNVLVPDTTVVTCLGVTQTFQPDYSEPNEGRLVLIENVTYSGIWPSPGNSGGVTINDGTGSCVLYIDRDTDLDEMTPPAGTFSVVGVIKQYGGFNPPWTGDYEVLARYSQDIIFPNAPRILTGPVETAIQPTSVTVVWTTDVPSSSVVEYGLTTTYGTTVTDATLVTDHAVDLTGLTPGTIYHFRVKSADANGTTVSGDRVFSSGSAAGSTGEMQVYFNKSVETAYSTGVPAQTVADLSSVVVPRLDAATHTIDACLYSFSLINVRDALIAAHNRGVLVRFIYETENYSSYIGNLISAGIPCIADDYGSNDGAGIMHNKFFVIDADARGEADPANDWVLTGSWNATISGNNPGQNHQNMVFIQDQALAGTYTREFEEMWGSTTMTPSPVNSRFGANKTNNTPHRFVINGIGVESYMSPSDAVSQMMADAILAAQKSCFFALMSFTRWTQHDALQYQWYNAAPCFQLRGVFDSAQGGPTSGSRYHDMIADAYAVDPWDPPADDIQLDAEGGTLHHKYAILDANDTAGNPTVITGSHNWSSAAETINDENTLLIHSPLIANLYLQEFAARYHAAGGVQPLVPVDDLAVTLNAQGSDLVMTWDPVACGYSYALYRFTTAHGDTTGATPHAIIPMQPTTYTDVGALGNPSVNYFYYVVPRNMGGDPFGTGARFGEFDYGADIPASMRIVVGNEQSR